MQLRENIGVLLIGWKRDSKNGALTPPASDFDLAIEFFYGLFYNIQSKAVTF